MTSAPLTFRRRSLIAFGLAIGLAYVLWNVAFFDFLMYPLRLFVTFVHEAGHGLAALLTGGQIGQLQVFPNGSGLAQTRGGALWLILPAGYLGAAAFGAGLLFIAHRVPHSRRVSQVLGVGVAAIALLYTPIFSTAWLVGLGIGLALIAAGTKLGDDPNLLILNLLAILTGLNAVFDLFGLVNNSQIGMGAIRNDAAAFSAAFAPLIPAWFWALVWALLALMMMGAAVWFGIIRKR